MSTISVSDANRTYHEAQSHMELLPNYYKWTYSFFRPYLRGTIIELGCGAGLGIRTYLDQVDDVYAIDYNPELLRRVGENLPTSRVRPLSVDLLGGWDGLQEVKADAVIMMDVLEHFADDRLVLSKAKERLKPEGNICLKVPAQSKMFSSIDQASGHFRRYDKQDLVDLAKQNNLKIAKLQYINQIGGLAYRLKRQRNTNFSKTFSPTTLKVINTLLPALALADRVNFFPGLSLIAVLRTEDK